jgi:hypothetical protein
MSNHKDDQLNLDKEGKEQLKEIVLARLNIMPPDVSVNIGSKDITKKQLVESVKSEDEVGRQMMAMELEFLQDLASGAVYKNE